MSLRDADRFAIISRFIHREISRAHAAELLDLTERQMSRLAAVVQSKGAKGLIHGNRGKPGHNRIPESERRRIARLLSAHYADFTPTLAAEKLAERHGIVRDPGTIRTIMTGEGLWTPRRKRSGSKHRSWRARKVALGEMVQFDGSYEDWFEERAPRSCLLAAIDDATSALLSAVFAPHEGVEPIFAFWKDYMVEHGVPRSVYLDRFSTYRMTQKVAVENHDLKTQFQRAMEELRCEPIFAHSPQAKGRVERLFRTLQDRLVKELRLAGISSIAEGNRFLKEVFLPRFNVRFSVAPASEANLHRPLSAKEAGRLDAIFARQEERTVRNDFTVSYRNRWFQLTERQPVTVCKSDTLTVEERLDGTLHFRLRGRYLIAEPLPERPMRKTGIPWVLAAKGDILNSLKR